MKLFEPLVAELEHEAGLTRKLLERVPEQHFDWKPHEKSMTLRQLASHLADVLSWTQAITGMDTFEVPADFSPFSAQTRSELLQVYDRNTAAAREAITGVSDEALGQKWTFKSGGEVKFAAPKAQVLRYFILNHQVHHRGQLAVYLRLKDVAVPSIYGPSADEAS